MDLEELVKLLKSKQNILILAGSLSERVAFENGSSPGDYVVILASKLQAVVGAATGTILQHCRREGIPAQKMWAAEIVQQLQKDTWSAPLPPVKPDLIVFIGYPPDIIESFGIALAGLDIVALANRRVRNVTFSAPDLSLKGWQDYLEDVVRAVA